MVNGQIQGIKVKNMIENYIDIRKFHICMMINHTLNMFRDGSIYSMTHRES